MEDEVKEDCLGFKGLIALGGMNMFPSNKSAQTEELFKSWGGSLEFCGKKHQWEEEMDK